MGFYKLSKAVEDDLARIYWRGVRDFGELKAEQYYFAFFDCFEKIASSPFQYPAVDHIRKGYRRSVCGIDCVYYRIVDNDYVEIMAIIGRQATENL